MTSTLYFPASSCISFSPPPCFIQPRYSPSSGPNGTEENIANAMSLPVKKPRLVQAESSEPDATASKYWLAGTSAPGSEKRRSIEPPDIFLTRSANETWPGPKIAIALGKAPPMFMRTRFSCASAAVVDTAMMKSGSEGPQGPCKVHDVLPKGALFRFGEHVRRLSTHTR